MILLGRNSRNTVLLKMYPQRPNGRTDGGFGKAARTRTGVSYHDYGNISISGGLFRRGVLSGKVVGLQEHGAGNVVVAAAGAGEVRRALAERNREIVDG